MRLDQLIPKFRALKIEHIMVEATALAVRATARRRSAACPTCGWRSRRIHSSYERTIADVPLDRRPVRLHVRVRRFHCTRRSCPQRIFAERFPGLVAPRGRRTLDQREMLEDLALALGGQAGSRLAARLGIPASRKTLLRLLRALPATETPTPKRLGIDDWSIRRGRSFGTILVDLDERRPIDLLPDRSTAIVAQWLAEHPGVEVIARDRAGAYAEAARQGAPTAVQVADRFHLLLNSGDALERLLIRHSTDLRAAAKAAVAAPTPAEPPAPEETSEPTVARLPSREARLAAMRRARRQARYDEIRALAEQGYSKRAIAQHLHVSRTTVIKYLSADMCPHPGARPQRRSPLDPWIPYLQERWASGCRNAQQLYREIQALGFPGGRSSVCARLTRWRADLQRAGFEPMIESPTLSRTVPPPLPAVPNWSPRRTRWLLLKEANDLTTEQLAYLRGLRERCPAIAQASELTKEFWRLVRERDEAGLDPWLTAARGSGVPELREFVAGIERDRAAVEAALRLEVSNGQTEGQITKLKLLKRAAYGRASLPLLRARLLRAS